MGLEILIVDDSKIFRTIVKRALSMSGLSVALTDEAGNGVEAVAKLADRTYDLMLTDLNMPGMDGRALVRFLHRKGLTSEMPVVVVSSERGDDQYAELRKHGVRGHLKKPFRPEQLRDVVEQAVRKEVSGADRS